MNASQTPDPPNPKAPTPVDPRIEKYMRGLLQNTDEPALNAMEELAHAIGFPIIDRLIGIFLQSLTKLHKSRRIFEFGSGYGYSAYWFARAAGPDAKIICSDGNPANRDLAERFLKQAGLWERIDFRVGLAQDLFVSTEGLFDLCYNDVDKGDYPEIWRMAKDRIAPGGLYIADNVLWNGRVVMDSPVDDVVSGWTE
ncbi:MAG: O-methyltransferase, partial [Methylococcales bacterium]